MRSLYRLFELKDHVCTRGTDIFHAPTLKEYSFVSQLSNLYPYSYSIEIIKGRKVNSLIIHSEAFKNWRAELYLKGISVTMIGKIYSLCEQTSILMSIYLPNKCVMFLVKRWQ